VDGSVVVPSTYPPSSAPRFLVDIGGEKFHEYSGYVSDVIVDTTVDGADHFRLSLIYPFDHEQVEFADLTWSTFEPGTAVSIAMGYGEGSGSTAEVFKGEIATIEPTFPKDQPPSVTIGGYCALANMMDGTTSTSWEETTLNSIVDEVAGAELDSITIEDADMQLARVFQNDQTPYRFVNQLAARYGFEFFTSLSEGYFRPSTGGSAPEDPVARLYYGESMESFSAVWSTPAVGDVEVRYWDESKKKEITGSASNNTGTKKSVYRIPVGSEAEADAVAEGLIGGEDISGVIDTFGMPSILAGKVVELDGVGSKFNNSYYVTNATHRIGADGYRMTAEVTAL